MVGLLREGMGYALYAIIIILGCMKKRSKKITILMCLYMWLLIALNNSTADYFAYEEMYLCSFEPRYSGHEIGFMTICRICLKLSFPYIMFRCVISFVIVYFTYKGLAYFTNRINFALALYLIFPFLGSASGLRQACSSAVILYLMRFLIEDGRKETIKYVIGVGIATLFHYSSVFYILYIIAKYKKSKNVSMFLQCAILTIVTLAISKTGVLYSIASKVISRQKTLHWLSSSGLYFSPLYAIVLGVFIFFLYAIYVAKSMIQRQWDDGICCNTKLEYKQVEIVSRAIIISLLAFIGAIYNSVVFLRLVTTLIPVGYAVCCDGFAAYASDCTQRYRICSQMKIGLIIFCILVSLFVFGYWIGGDVLTVPVKNYLFGG